MGASTRSTLLGSLTTAMLVGHSLQPTNATNKSSTTNCLDALKPVQKNKMRSSSSVCGNNSMIDFNRNSILLDCLGTRPSQLNSLRLEGTFELPEPNVVVQNSEDEGSIPLATPVKLEPKTAVIISGFIGDGAFGTDGTQSGDVDYFRIDNVEAGQEIYAKVDTDIPGFLTFNLEIRNATGDLLTTGTDRGFPPRPELEFIAPSPGSYYLSIAGADIGGLVDPFDSSSGPGDQITYDDDYRDGRLIEGGYDILIGLDYVDKRKVILNAQQGDVFGAAVDTDFATLKLTDPQGDLRIGSEFDRTVRLPESSPLPSGAVSLQHVMDMKGKHVLEVSSRESGSSSFKLDATSNIPPSRLQPKGTVQKLFIDFDGANVVPAIINELTQTDEASLSPLSAFLSSFDLSPEDENAVIDKALEVIEKTLRTDIIESGVNPRYDLEILNSRDNPDVFGEPNVSRVIIGGTAQELGDDYGGLGFSESVDPGNFALEETGIVPLDVIAGLNPFIPFSLNDIELSPGAKKTDLVGQAIGSFAAQQAALFYGSSNTVDFTNGDPQVTDRTFASQEEFARFVGAGQNAIYGDGDDVRATLGVRPSNFGVDNVNSLTTTAFGVSPPLPGDAKFKKQQATE